MSTDSNDSSIVPTSASGPREVELTAPGYLPEGMEATFADGLAVLVTDGVVVLTFMQTEFPIIEKGGAPPTEIRRKCIARLVVAKPKMREFLQVLNRVAPSIAEKE